MLRIVSENVDSDITVIGGGLAGVCAAIAAARAGARVSLVQNRSVLGGNSSSEIRVWVCGATGHGEQSLARETGIMGELYIENQFRNADGNPYYWDLVLSEAIRAEPGIRLFLDTDVREVELAGGTDGEIGSVTGWMMGSERKLVFRSRAYIDCTGDGLVGALAGADFRVGREAREVYGESWAPIDADSDTLGSTLLFYTKRVGHSVPYVPPVDFLDMTQTSILEFRHFTTESKGCDFWWIEWGGEESIDIVADNDRIRKELQYIVHGIWNWIKNSGNFDASDLTLEWVGSIPGKREYRRFVGGVTLTQADIIGLREWPDNIGFGGWSIDLHPPGGIYAKEAGSHHLYPDGPYQIPLRCLYSANVSNLWFAGRDISASHVAFGTTRVMATCAVTGEAAGVGAALALQSGLRPGELATGEAGQTALRRALMRADSSVMGVADDDPENLALLGTAHASSWLDSVKIENPTDALPLDHGLGIVVPVRSSLGSISLLLSGRGTVHVEAWTVRAGQVYAPYKLVAEASADVDGALQWVEFPLPLEVQAPQNLFVVVGASEGIDAHLSDKPLPGVISFVRRAGGTERGDAEGYRDWKPFDVARAPCLRVGGSAGVYHAENVIGGYSRPFAGPNMWVSAPRPEDPDPWVEVRWDEPVWAHEVDVILDASIEIDLINLHHHYTPWRVMPGLLTAYELSAETEDGWVVIDEVRDNHLRLRHQVLDVPLCMKAVRVTARESGVEQARVVNVRVR